MSIRIAYALAGLLGCTASTEIEPARARDGEWVVIHGDGFAGHGGVIVTFADLPARGVVIESDRLIRAQLPVVPVELRGREVEVELEFADGVRREVESGFWFEVGVEVRGR